MISGLFEPLAAEIADQLRKAKQEAEYLEDIIGSESILDVYENALEVEPDPYNGLMIDPMDIPNHVKKSTIATWVWNRVHKDDRDCLIAVYGPRGVGKSISCIVLAMQIDSTFKLETMKDRFVTSASEFIEIIEKDDLPRGACIIWDDAGASGVGAREHMSQTSRAINYIVQTQRERHLVVFFTSPMFWFMDAGIRAMFTAHWEILKRDNDKKVVYTKFKRVSRPNNLTREPFLKFLINQKTGKKLGLYKIHKVDPEIIKVYKRIRTKMFKSVLEEAKKILTKRSKEKEAKESDDGKPRCPACGSKSLFKRAKRSGCRCKSCGEDYSTYPPGSNAFKPHDSDKGFDFRR